METLTLFITIVLLGAVGIGVWGPLRKARAERVAFPKLPPEGRRLSPKKRRRVEATGLVQPGPKGPLRAPLSGREVVAYRIQISEFVFRDWEARPSVRRSRRFFVNRGDGNQVHVFPKLSQWVRTHRTVEHCGAEAPSRELEELMRARGESVITKSGQYRNLRVIEDVVAVGADIVVSGMLKGPSQAALEERGAYRTNRVGRIVFRTVKAGVLHIFPAGP